MAVVVPIAAQFDDTGIERATTEFQLFGQAMERTFQQAAANARKSFASVESSAQGASKDLKKTADDADRSRSVFANFAGNAAQEIPGLSAAFGPLNTAIGQFTEYAAEGNIKLRGLVAVAGPLAAIGLVVGGFSNQFQTLAADAEFATERVERFTQSLLDGKDAAQTLREEFAKGVTVRGNDPNAYFGLNGFVSKIKEVQNLLPGAAGDIAGFIGLFEKKKTVDVTPVLNRLGIDLNTVIKLAKAGTPTINSFVQALKDSGAAGDDANIALQVLTSTADQLVQAERNAATVTTFLAANFANAVPPGQELGQVLGFIDLNAKNAADRLKQAETQVQNLTDTVLASVNAEFAYADAQDDVANAIARAQVARAKAKKAGATKADIRDAERAERDVLRATLRQASAAGELAASNNTLSTGLDSATVANIGFYESLQKTAQQFRPGGAFRGPLDDIVERLASGFPPEIRTRIVIDISTGQVSRTGTIGSPFGAGLFAPGVSVPVVTTGNNASTVNNITVNGLIGNQAQLAEAIRKIMNDSSSRRAAAYILG